jgi:ribonuclease E
MFHKYGLEHDMKTLESRTVLLPSGGSIVIEPTEALISIDVNSGKTHGRRSEDTACRTNLEAAEEVARQLRLRDLGGLVAVDFIDMDEPAHRRQVEDVLRRALERPRERVKILPMSDFGIVELTRQRTRATQWGLGDPCPHCNGSGRTMFYSGKEGNGEGKAKGF